MANYKVYVSEPAENDLRDIIQYISAQLAAPFSAASMMSSFENALNSLSDLPDRCPLVNDSYLANLGYHKLVVKNYIIFYTTNERNKTVDVERILYAKRDWINII